MNMMDFYTAASSSKTFNTPGLIGSYLMIPNEEVREKFLMHTRRKDFLNSVSIFWYVCDNDRLYTMR